MKGKILLKVISYSQHKNPILEWVWWVAD